MYIILIILLFGVLIATHELGHFIVAKLCGVKVLEFSIGMGPQVFHRQIGETDYSLRALPLGGFCAMEGEGEDSTDPRAFSAQKPWKRLLILAAGATMNFIVGFALVVIVFSQAAAYNTPIISSFFDGCPYEGENAMMVGDEIYRIDGHRIYFSGNVSTFLDRGDDRHDIVLRRNGAKIKLDDYPMSKIAYETESGTQILYGLTFSGTDATAGNLLKYSWYCTVDYVRLVWRSLADLVTGHVGFRDMAGIVGIVDVVNDAATEAAQESQTATAGILMVLNNFALIAVNLAVMNLLPIPALDGGQILLLIISAITEKLFHKKPSEKLIGRINNVFFALLMTLMVVILFSDVIKIILK